MQLTAVNKNVSGIIYMLVAMLALSTMDAVAKFLVKGTFDPIQILAVRSWLILFVMLVYYVSRRRLHQLKTKRPVAHILRGALGFLAPYCFFKSLQTLPLGDATVIFFSSTFMITALSWPLLKEKVGFYRWCAVVLGFGGVLVAMDPSGEGAIVSYAYCLFGSFSYALLFLSGRWLSRTESVVSLVFSFNLCMAIVASSLAPLVWVPINAADYLPLLVFSALALIGHYCVTSSFSKADVAVIAPLEYTALIWAIFWGYFIWGDVPGWRVWSGGAIIIACALFVIYRESIAKPKQLKKKAHHEDAEIDIQSFDDEAAAAESTKALPTSSRTKAVDM